MIREPVFLFDLDGTLTDNYRGISASIVHAMQCLDVPAPDTATLRGCVGPPLRESFARLLETRDAVLIERAIAHYRERFADVGWRENVVYDGIDAILSTLAARASRMFICTAKPEVFARRIAAHFGFDAHLDGVYGADLAGALDDKTRLLAHLLATERIEAAAALMIGDRANDIRAAHENGARAVGVLWGYGTRDELSGADALVAGPEELPDVLAQMIESEANRIR